MTERNLSGAEVRHALARIEVLAYQAAAIDGDAARAVQREISRMEALAPIVEPTWYQRNMGNVQQRAQLVSAFLKFRAAVLKIEPDFVAKVESENSDD